MLNIGLVSGLVLNCAVLLCLTYLPMFYFATIFLFCFFKFYFCCLWWRIKLCVTSSDVDSEGGHFEHRLGHKRHVRILWWYFNTFIEKLSVLMWKSIANPICMVTCLHNVKVRHFGSVRCRIHFWLMCYKNVKIGQNLRFRSKRQFLSRRSR